MEMFTNLGYVSTRALRVALVVALGATLAAALATVALVAASPAARAADGNCQGCVYLRYAWHLDLDGARRRAAGHL